MPKTTPLHPECNIGGGELSDALEMFADGDKAAHVRMLIGLHRLLEGSKHGSAVQHSIEEYIDRHAVEARVCPGCGGDLVVRTWQERVGECGNAPAYQKFGVDHCESCGWEG